VVFDSSVFPEQNGDAKTRLTVSYNIILLLFTVYPQVMMGGAWYKEVFSTSTTTSDMEEVALKALQHSLGINQDPTMCNVSIHKVCQYVVLDMLVILYL